MAECPDERQVDSPAPVVHFQFSLAELLLVVLSIGGSAAAWSIGWVSFTLPIVLGWLWWLAYDRESWLHRVTLCFLAPALLFWFGIYYVTDSWTQSQVQRALPLDWLSVQYVAAEEQLRRDQPLDKVEVYVQPCLALTYTWTWGVLVPALLAGIGVLVTQRRWVRDSQRGWAATGISLGLFVVVVLAGYPIIRSALRRSAFQANWHLMDVMYYEGALGSNQRSVTICVADERSSACSGDRFLIAQQRAEWTSREYGDPPSPEDVSRWETQYAPKHLSVNISRRDAEELWTLLESAKVFSLNHNLYPFGRIDGLDRNLKILAGPHGLRIDSWAWTPQDVPMYRFKRMLLAWLREKGFSEPAHLFPIHYNTDAEYAQAIVGCAEADNP